MSWVDQSKELLARHRVLCLLTRLDEVPAPSEDQLPAQDQQRLAGIQHPLVRSRFICGRWALRTLFARVWDPRAKDLNLETTVHGKPYFDDASAPRFNMSHSGDWVALAVSLDGDVGVDVERSRRRIQLDSLLRRVCSPGERRWMAGRDIEDFFEIWTRKEALLKARGNGFETPLHDVDTEDVIALSREDWHLHPFKPENGMHGCLVHKAHAGKAALRVVHVGVLLESDGVAQL